MKTLSIVIPFYKRVTDLAFSLPFNVQYFQGDDREVVLVLDEPTQQTEVLALVQQYPTIHWKVIVNPNDHEWRNPAKAINVGIRNASKEYVLVMSPESILINDTPNKLLEHTSETSFATGYVAFATRAEILAANPETCYLSKTKIRIPWGSICFNRQVVADLHGYCTITDLWGGEDMNIRRRLILHNISQNFTSLAWVLHSSEVAKNVNSRPKVTGDSIYEISHPASACYNDLNWGLDFNNIIYTS